jgi:hypothetical protein
VELRSAPRLSAAALRTRDRAATGGGGGLAKELGHIRGAVISCPNIREHIGILDVCIWMAGP